MPADPSPAEILARLYEQAEGMFAVLAEVRLEDAKSGRTDSDIFYAQCRTLANLRLITPARADALDAEVRASMNAWRGLKAQQRGNVLAMLAQERAHG